MIRASEGRVGWFGILLIFLVIFIYLNKFNKRPKVNGDFIFTVGNVYIGGSPKGGGYMNYKFIVNKDTIIGSRGIGGSYSRSFIHFIGKRFIVVYQNGCPNNNELLLSREDFNRYDLDYPDSMQWANRFYD